MATFHFSHPGTFLSASNTKTLQNDVQANPIRKKALEKLIKDTPLTYRPQALEKVDIDWGGKGIGHKECTKDGETAVAATLLFWATGDRRYGALAISILREWSTINKIFRGNNAPLEAAWSVCSMARAAELLKYSSLQKEWQSVEPAFLIWLDDIIMPVLKEASLWRWDFINNWHFSIVCARMQIAILREDQKEWQWAIDTYKCIFPKALVLSDCIGETTEVRRDLTHSQMLLGGMAQAAEMAWHQDIDIYDQRLIHCVELQSRIMMGEVPNGLTKECIKTPYGFWPEPVYEIPFAHFQGRKKIPMPNTWKYLQKVRPDRVTFHWGPNTLTHAQNLV